MRTTFAAAVGKVKVLLGDDPAQWSWGKLHTATLHHPLGGLGPAYAKAFDLGPVPRDGDAQTPNNTRHDDQFRQVHGASYRQLFDLGDWDRGLATSVPGQSGQPGSPHYADQFAPWLAGEYHVVALRRAEVEGDLEGTTILEPAPPSVTTIIPGEDHPPDGPTVRS